MSDENQTKICKFCREGVDPKAKWCPHCGKDLRYWSTRHPIISVIIVFVFFSYFIGNILPDDLTSDSSSSSGSILNSISNTKSEPEPEPNPINLSGTGQQASKKFTLEKGLSIFKITHSGSSHFGIWLLDSNGDKVELLVNEIGSFNGSKAVQIEEKGTYILDISANGKWTVNIEQPRPTTGLSIPKTISGKGQKASEFIKIPKGLTTFQITHNGSSHFGIWLLNRTGNKVELLVNEIGNFNGSKAIRIPEAGIYLLDVSADGNWSVTID